jgi:hypothetical protein
MPGCSTTSITMRNHHYLSAVDTVAHGAFNGISVIWRMIVLGIRRKTRCHISFQDRQNTRVSAILARHNDGGVSSEDSAAKGSVSHYCLNKYRPEHRATQCPGH